MKIPEKMNSPFQIRRLPDWNWASRRKNTDFGFFFSHEVLILVRQLPDRSDPLGTVGFRGEIELGVPSPTAR
jgi:hypothetical protein